MATRKKPVQGQRPARPADAAGADGGDSAAGAGGPAARATWPAEAGGVEATRPAKAGTAKAAGANTGTAKAGAAKAGTSKASTAKAAGAKTGTAKTGTAKTGGGAAGRGRSVMARQRAREQARRRAWIAAGVAAALLVIAGFAGWYAYQSQRPDTPAGPVTPPAGADATGVRIGTGPVTVDVYLDFMCPHCRDFEERAADTLAGLARDGRATVVYHPLAFLDSASSTDYSTRSAAAAGCAADAGRFVEYQAALYAQQPAEGSAGLTEQQLINLGSVAGITGSGFEQCVRADRHLAWVDGVTEAAVKKNVRGTPTVHVNGRQVDADPEAITEAVANA